jgi:hypothetical protein
VSFYLEIVLLVAYEIVLCSYGNNLRRNPDPASSHTESWSKKGVPFGSSFNLSLDYVCQGESST